jgi:hypothetical protein
MGGNKKLLKGGTVDAFIQVSTQEKLQEPSNSNDLTTTSGD